MSHKLYIFCCTIRFTVAKVGCFFVYSGVNIIFLGGKNYFYSYFEQPKIRFLYNLLLLRFSNKKGGNSVKTGITPNKNAEISYFCTQKLTH